MSLVFAAITPHTPLLIPTIGRDNVKKLAETQAALEQLEQELYLSNPETVIIISPHTAYFPTSFTVNFTPNYETDLREFGDLATRIPFKGDAHLPHAIASAAKHHNLPVTLVSEHGLDHGTSVPLVYLAKHLSRVHIVPVSISELDWKTHLDFGCLLKEVIAQTNKRIAVIASGDLSHALITDAPAGYNPAGPEFDAKIQELLSTNNIVGMLHIDKQMVNDAAECGFRTFLILMGILQGMHHTYKSLAYEAPFGIGHLTAQFVFS